MDTKTGNIYESFRAGSDAIVAELRRQGVPETRAREQAAIRLVSGQKPTLRKLQKMIRAQAKRESKEEMR